MEFLENHFAAIIIIEKIHSVLKFAHVVMTLQLSWHMQTYELIRSLFFK